MCRLQVLVRSPCEVLQGGGEDHAPSSLETTSVARLGGHAALGAASRPHAGRIGSSRRVRLRGVGKKGTAAARAAERKRIRAALVIGVHPTHDGVSPPARAPGHLGGAAVLGDVKEGERPLAGAGMRCAHSQVAQILWRLTPARIVNA